MNNEQLKKIVSNFNELQWSYDNDNKIAVYKNDNNLKMKLENKRSRNVDENFKQKQWSEFLDKYYNMELIDIMFLYNNEEIDGCFTGLIIDKIVIPIPVAANMIDIFYENEINITKMISTDTDKFHELTKHIKICKNNSL